jgi:hypothetical protein
MRLGAWKIYVSDELSMSESKVERELSGARRGSRGWQILREAVANIKECRKSVYVVGSLA